MKGLEINPYAAELARVSVWIGEIQWMRRNGFYESRDPILKPLDTIECRDAILTPDGTEPDWPQADVIIGNPPFLGSGLQILKLGEDYVARLRRAYTGRVPGGADLVCYWFAKAGTQIGSGAATRAGLVATNSIRGGASRRALQQQPKHSVSSRRGAMSRGSTRARRCACRWSAFRALTTSSGRKHGSMDSASMRSTPI